MPSASAKLEKQASTETTEPIRQGITIIEHKIRNLEKRKSRLESYRDQQSNGKELNSDQLAAIAKYDEVQQTLEFARDLCKQFQTIALEATRQQKKQARKDALEKLQHEQNRIKEILLVQDVLANMGQDTIREDFLAGKSGAIKLTEEDLQHLDDLFTEVSPKREVEEGCPPFSEQVQKAAEHLIHLMDGKNKEVIGTTYGALRQKIHEIHSCGYFDSSSSAALAPEGGADINSSVIGDEDVEGEEEPVTVPTATFQSTKNIVAQQSAPTQQIVNEPTEQNSTIVQAQPPANEVISSVMSVGNSSFHFLQDSELESPDVVAPTAPPPSALPIPTQTFTNQNFVPPPQSYNQQAQPQPVYAPIPIPGQQASYTSFTTGPPLPPQSQHPQTYQQPPPAQPQPPQQVEHITDWSDASAGGIESTDWNVQCEAAAAAAAAASADNPWQLPKQHHHHQQQSDWGAEVSSHHGSNDGFVPAGGRGGGGRGGRGRGSRGGPRGGGGRGGGGGAGGRYYNNSGDNSGNNYYQSNGFQNRNMGDRDHKRGGSGGQRGGPGGPRSDRGGPRGGSRGSRGSNRQ